MTEETKDAQPATAPVTAATEAAAQTQPAADLNLNDLAALKSIIDVATQRGAFKANELEAVGKLYNKLTTFLDTVSKKD